MYAVYRELHPPTGVEHCLECHFFGPRRKSLAVAAASVLKVYDLCHVSPTRRCRVRLTCLDCACDPIQVENNADKDGAGDLFEYDIVT